MHGNVRSIPAEADEATVNHLELFKGSQNGVFFNPPSAGSTVFVSDFEKRVFVAEDFLKRSNGKSIVLKVAPQKGQRFSITLLIPPAEVVCILNTSEKSATNWPNFMFPRTFLNCGSSLYSSDDATPVNIAPFATSRVLRDSAYGFNSSRFLSSVCALPLKRTLIVVDLLSAGTGFDSVIL